MTWIAWRQQRLSILISVGLVVACAIVAVWVRIAVTRDLSAAGLTNCWPTTDDCRAGGIDAIIDKYAAYRTLYPFVGLASSWARRSSPVRVDSGFSLMNSTVITASNAIGAPTRNRSAVAMP